MTVYLPFITIYVSFPSAHSGLCLVFFGCDVSLFFQHQVSLPISVLAGDPLSGVWYILTAPTDSLLNIYWPLLNQWMYTDSPSRFPTEYILTRTEKILKATQNSLLNTYWHPLEIPYWIHTAFRSVRAFFYRAQRWVASLSLTRCVTGTYHDQTRVGVFLLEARLTLRWSGWNINPR